MAIDMVGTILQVLVAAGFDDAEIIEAEPETICLPMEDGSQWFVTVTNT
jgi:hypothetical protein